MADPLTNPNTTLRFSGHETFPLRLLWLRKAYDVAATRRAHKRTFHEHDAIARFGVGKNMALAMRHWALAAGIIAENPDDDLVLPTPFGDAVFAEGGYDPYLEEPTTLWLVHAAFATAPSPATTIYYAFNHLNKASFTRDEITGALFDVASRRGVRATVDTIKRDVEVFVRSYYGRGGENEDAAEPLLAELGLVTELGHSGQFEFARGPKPTLSDGVFAIVLRRFWDRSHGGSPTLAVERLAYDPGSPGRVFKLDEDSLVTRLMRISDVSSGTFQWTDTAGLRQVALARPIASLDEGVLLERAYLGTARP